MTHDTSSQTVRKAPTWMLVVGLLSIGVGAVLGQGAKHSVLAQNARARGLDPRNHRASLEEERAASDSPAVLLPTAGLGVIGLGLVVVYFTKRRRSSPGRAT